MESSGIPEDPIPDAGVTTHELLGLEAECSSSLHSTQFVGLKAGYSHLIVPRFRHRKQRSICLPHFLFAFEQGIQALVSDEFLMMMRKLR
jgi:hypothetical protein